MAMSTATAEKVLALLEEIAETDEVRQNLDIALFDQGILDSLATVELMVALSGEFGIQISPAEIEREDWATPRKIVAYVENKLAA